MWNLGFVGVGGCSQGFLLQLAMVQVAAKAAMYASRCIVLVNVVFIAWDELGTGERLNVILTIGKMY